VNHLFIVVAGLDPAISGGFLWGPRVNRRADEKTAAGYDPGTVPLGKVSQ
jgi:hypothetical protein